MKKILKTGALLLVCALFTIISTLNLNAGVVIKKTWTPQNSTMVPGERSTFSQYLITTDEVDSIEAILVEVRGAPAARNAFKQVVVENGFGRIIGRGSPLVDSTLVWIHLEQTVLLPETPLYIAPKADVNVGAVVTDMLGKGITMVVKEIHLSGERGISLTEEEGTGAIHQVALVANGIGSLTSIQRLGGTVSVFSGPRQFLGGFMVTTGAAEDFSSLPNIQIHLSGGQVSDIGNLQAVILTQDGNWSLCPLYQESEHSSRKDNYYGNFISFGAQSTSLIGVFGDLGESFSSGNSTIAVSTNPGKWKSVWGRRSGKELTLPNGMVIGPTIKVTPKPPEGKG